MAMRVAWILIWHGLWRGGGCKSAGKGVVRFLGGASTQHHKA